MANDYENIDQPYNSSLDRSVSNPTPANNGNVMTQPVKSDGDSGDVWINNFIRSVNWQPKNVGFYINGQTGYAEFSNVFVSGNIQALTGTIGGFTINATNLSVTSGGNTVTISSGTNAFIAGPTGSPSAIITQAGAATFVGVTTLNIKAYTDFETAGRFSTTLTGSGGSLPGAGGLAISTGVTPTSSAVTIWSATDYTFNNSPTFSCVVKPGTLNVASGSGGAVFGLGEVGLDGTGISFGARFCGFFFQKSSGVVNVYGKSSDGSGSSSITPILTTAANGDVFDLILKINGSTSADFYWRKNGGDLSSKTSLFTQIPTAQEDSITFGTTNVGTGFNYSFSVYSASYER